MTDYRKELTGLAGYFANPSPKTSTHHKKMVRKLAELGEKMGAEMPPAVAPRVMWSESKNKLFIVYTDESETQVVELESGETHEDFSDAEEMFTDQRSKEILAGNSDFHMAQVALAELLEMRSDQNASQIRERIAEIKHAWKHHEKRADEQEKRVSTLLEENSRLTNELNKLQADLTKSCGRDENHTPHLHITDGNTPSFCNGAAVDHEDDEDREYW